MNIPHILGVFLGGAGAVPDWVPWVLQLGLVPLGASFLVPLIMAGATLAGSVLSGRRGRGQFKDSASFSAEAREQLMALGIPVTKEAIGFLRDIVNNGGLSEESQAWLGEMQQQFPELKQEMLDFGTTFDMLPPEIRNNFSTVLDSISQSNDRNIDTLRQPGGMTPEQQGTFNRATQFGNGQTDEQNILRDSGFDILNNRGSTEQSRFLFESAQDARNRVNDPRFDSLLNNAGGIIGNNGFTQQGQQLFDAEMGIINAGGQTADSQRLIGATQGIIDAGGMTPEIQAALGQVESELKSGGLTPEGRLILDEMTQIVQARGRGGALLGFDEALGRAGNLAARDSEAGREALIAQARQRATPGSVIGSGLVGADTGRLLAQDFAARTAAVDRAALQQQQLQMQQLMGAGGVSAEILNGANQRYGALLGSRGDILRAASSNLSSAIQGNVGAQGVETSRLIGAINGANATNSTAANMFNSAVNLTGTVLDHQLGLLNLSANAANMSGAMQNQNMAIGNSMVQGLLGSMQQGNQLAGVLSTAGANQRQAAINSILQGGQVGNQTTGLMNQARGQNLNFMLGVGQLQNQNNFAIMDALQRGDTNALNAALSMANIGSNATGQAINANGQQLQAGQGLQNSSTGFFRNMAGAGFTGLGNWVNAGGLDGLFGGGAASGAAPYVNPNALNIGGSLPGLNNPFGYGAY